MDENGRRAARRRAVIAFVVAGVLLVAEVVGFAVVRHDGYDGPGRRPGWEQFGGPGGGRQVPGQGRDGGRFGPMGPGYGPGGSRSNGNGSNGNGNGNGNRSSSNGGSNRSGAGNGFGPGSRGGTDGSSPTTSTSTTTTTTAVPGGGI
jgi:hypothetical protein